MMLGLERPQVRGDSEQLADKILNVRREFDNQLGLLLALKCARVGTSAKQTLTERLIGRLQLFEEGLIEARQTFPLVQVFKREPKPEG
jgi:hypothetical protein